MIAGRCRCYLSGAERRVLLRWLRLLLLKDGQKGLLVDFGLFVVEVLVADCVAAVCRWLLLLFPFPFPVHPFGSIRFGSDEKVSVCVCVHFNGARMLLESSYGLNGNTNAAIAYKRMAMGFACNA